MMIKIINQDHHEELARIAEEVGVPSVSKWLDRLPVTGYPQSLEIPTDIKGSLLDICQHYADLQGE